MKTQWLKKYKVEEKFFERFKTLVRLSDDTRASIIDWILKLDRIPRLDAEDLSDLVSKTGESLRKIADSVGATLTLLRRAGQFEEDVTAFIDDLRTLHVLEKDEDYEILRQFFEKLRSMVHTIFLFQRKEFSIIAGMPYLMNSSMAVSIKPVFRKSFDYGEDELPDYEPELVGYVPAGQIELKNSSSESHFCFQVDSDVLNRLISDLLALQMELKAASKTASQLENAIHSKSKDE